MVEEAELTLQGSTGTFTSVCGEVKGGLALEGEVEVEEGACTSLGGWWRGED